MRRTPQTATLARRATEVERFLNLAILKEPFNWITVVLMVMFGLLVLAVLSPETETPSD